MPRVRVPSSHSSKSVRGEERLLCCRMRAALLAARMQSPPPPLTKEEVGRFRNKQGLRPACPLRKQVCIFRSTPSTDSQVRARTCPRSPHISLNGLLVHAASFCVKDHAVAAKYCSKGRRSPGAIASFVLRDRLAQGLAFLSSSAKCLRCELNAGRTLIVIPVSGVFPPSSYVP